MLEKSFYITEQSDAWACIDISGSQTHSCLERICTLDLSNSAYEINSATRTLMEHLNVFVIKVTEEKFYIIVGQFFRTFFFGSYTNLCRKYNVKKNWRRPYEI